MNHSSAHTASIPTTTTGRSESYESLLHAHGIHPDDHHGEE
jgi:hypothetical protein